MQAEICYSLRITLRCHYKRYQYVIDDFNNLMHQVAAKLSDVIRVISCAVTLVIAVAVCYW